MREISFVMMSSASQGNTSLTKDLIAWTVFWLVQVVKITYSNGWCFTVFGTNHGGKVVNSKRTSADHGRVFDGLSLIIHSSANYRPTHVNEAVYIDIGSVQHDIDAFGYLGLDAHREHWNCFQLNLEGYKYVVDFPPKRSYLSLIAVIIEFFKESSLYCIVNSNINALLNQSSSKWSSHLLSFPLFSALLPQPPLPSLSQPTALFEGRTSLFTTALQPT